MGHQAGSPFEDLLEPLRRLGWTAVIEDDHTLRLEHPLGDHLLVADTPEQLRRMLGTQFSVDNAFMRALREAPLDRTEDLAVVGDIIRVCRSFSPDPRLASAIVGVMADNGFVDARTYEWFRGHAEAVVGAQT